MLRKLRDFWKDWWPLISGAPVALYSAFAYLTGAQDDIFLLARLFRWELLLVLFALACLSLVYFLTPRDSAWRPINALRAALGDLRDAPASPAARVASATLLVAALLFAAAFCHWFFETYAFLRVRYQDVDRQQLVAQAGEVELSQDLPRAIALYKSVLERFPYNRFNNDIEAKIASLEEREAGWKRVADSVRAFEARWPEGKATTRFDRMAEACRYISNSAPCTRIEDYVGEVQHVVEQAQTPGATCRSVVSATPDGSAWVFLDPNDSKWLGIAKGDAARICATLGLTSGDELASYLYERWYLSTIEELAGAA